MKKTLSTLLIAGSAFILSSCSSMITLATVPITFESAYDIKRDKIFDLSKTIQYTNTLEVLITRDKGAVGSLCAVTLSVNGNDVADFKPRERLKLYLTAGTHIFGIQYRGFCGDGALIEQAFNISSQVNNRFRISSGMRTGLNFGPSALL